MHPVVAKVVGIEKTLIEAKAKIMELDLGGVIGEDRTSDMVYPVLPTVNEEGMEMDVGPAHDELNNIMEISNRAVAAD
jgi:hypothetical protein